LTSRAGTDAPLRRSSLRYEVSDDTDSVQMLQRSTQVGEFYRMRAPAVPPKEPTDHMYDIIIYDEEQDKHQHIRFLDALDAAIPTDIKQPEGGWFGTKLVNGISPPGDKAAAIEAITGTQNNNTPVWVPMEIVIARPFIEHLMMSAVMTVSGRDTGATLFGPAGKLTHTLPHRHTRQLTF